MLLDHGSLGLITWNVTSSDYSITNSYELRAYASGTTTPTVSTYNVGLPGRSTTGQVSVQGWAWLSALSAGDYDVGVAAVGSSGLPGSESSSQSNVFTVPLVAP